MNAARIGRQELVARLSRDALFALSMPSLPASARPEIEHRLAADQRVTAKELNLRAKADPPIGLPGLEVLLEKIVLTAGSAVKQLRRADGE
jgi:hypothetical protein